MHAGPQQPANLLPTYAGPDTDRFWRLLYFETDHLGFEKAVEMDTLCASMYRSMQIGESDNHGQ